MLAALISTAQKVFIKPAISPLGADDTLVLGGLYRNRHGDYIRIRHHRPSQGLYASFGLDFVDDKGDKYYANGRVFRDTPSDLDLVEVVH